MNYKIQKPRWSGGACYVTSWYATYQAFLLYRRILVPSSRAEDDGLELGGVLAASEPRAEIPSEVEGPGT